MSALQRFWRRPQTAQPGPQMRIYAGPAITVAWLRAALLVLGVGALLLIAPAAPLALLGASVLAGATWRPAPVSGAVLAGALGLLWSVQPLTSLTWRQPLILLLIPLCWALAGQLADLPDNALVEWRVLTGQLRPFLLINAYCQLLLGAAVLWRSSGTPGGSAAELATLLFAGVVATSSWVLGRKLLPPPAGAAKRPRGGTGWRE